MHIHIPSEWSVDLTKPIPISHRPSAIPAWGLEMRKHIMLFLIAALAVAAMPSYAALKTLAEWRFNTDGDTAGWTVGSNVANLTVKDGFLMGHVSGSDPSVAGPQFEITASPYQYVEIRMKTTAPGSGELFYTNTTEEPYGGFRSNLMRRISYKDGDFQVYHIFPFWQDLGKIIRLRIDPPENCDFAIDYVKVVEVDTPAVKSAFFDFTKADQAWSSADDILTDVTADGIVVKAPGEWMLLSPKLDLDTSAYPIFTMSAKSTGSDSAVLTWLSDRDTVVRSQKITLRTDGKWHAYNVMLGDTAEWTGRIKMLSLRGELSDGQQVQFRTAGLSNKRIGQGEFEIRNFGLKDPVTRLDPKKPAILQAELVNAGGQPIKSEITVRFRISPGNKLSITPVTLPSAVGLKPGGSETLTFQVVPERPGSCDVELTVDNAESSASASSSLLWLAPVNAQPATYVPEPKPVRGDFDIGMYYYPGWSTYRAWSVLNNFPERRPLLGYYKEGDPQVADWQIKWMVEHGVTFVVYDWYWSAGGRSLEHAIHQGFFNSKYHDQIKFCLLWANHNAAGTSSAEDMVNVTNYWLDNYFARPDYYKVDGKPVVVIFSPNRLTEDMGVEGVKAAFDKAREMAKAKGLPGIYFVACAYPGNTKVLEQEGYDALSGYNYPSAGDNGQNVAPYADNVTGYQDFWNRIADNTSLRYIPVTDPGWDSRPWHGSEARVWTGKTPLLFKQMLLNAKYFVETRNPDAKQKMVLVEAWNEFGEGDFVEPNAGFGFGHLDAIREVFTTAAPEHDDLVPQDVSLTVPQIEKPKAVTAWEFDDPAAPGWELQMGLKDMKVADSSLTAVASSNDPALSAWTDGLDSKTFKAVEFRMKVDKGKGAQLFWTTPAWSFNEDASARFDLKADGQFHTYKVDLSKSSAWKSKITSLRFDPTDTTGATVAIDYIRFLKR